MKVCILSNYGGSLDEGMMNISYHLSEELSRDHDVFHVNARKSLLSNSFWRKIRVFNPQIIHVILRPSLFTFLVANLVKRHCSQAKILLSALQPPRNLFNMRLASALKPDLVLIQSADDEKLFTRLGCKTFFLPNGVDTNKFLPVSESVKAKLRKKYSVDPQKFVILHVGHIVKGRNLEVLAGLQEKDNQVIVVGSTIFDPDKHVYNTLRNSGCLVWREYFHNIEELYALSDCYLFPTTSKSNSVAIPLSVMEAMSCNLPVISTKFGMLHQIFPQGEGLTFVDKNVEFQHELNDLKTEIKRNSIRISTRNKVLPYSWDKVTAELERAYIITTAM